MEDLDFNTLLLEEMTNEQQDFLEFRQFLESTNSCYELPGFQETLPMTPPNSCPVTPTSSEPDSNDVIVQEVIKEFRTDTPELEHYLRSTNPLEGLKSKRRCDSSRDKNEKGEIKRLRKERLNETDEGYCRKNPKVSEKLSGQNSMKWSNYSNEDWCGLYNSSLIESESPSLQVTCDKGFSFSASENVFICQKKNHFQITLVLNVPNIQSFIKVKDVYQSVTSYKVHLYAVKAEAPHKRIDMEQSLADRSKRPYYPVKFPTNEGSSKTLTIGRLHFSETTSNNMRKKGKLNPDQRYFLLVVDVHAYTKQGNYSVCCQASEKLIVRASNPGQFENDVALWAKEKSGDSVFRMGNVGINTDKPDECLTVNGNLRLTGQILQPSDTRVKEIIEKTDTRQHLENVRGMQLYKYRLDKAYAEYAGISEDKTENVGVMAHELNTLIPEAITEASNITLPDGKIIKNLLLVDKDRLLMESLGALQELYKITKRLTTRLVELESRNKAVEIVLRNAIIISKTEKDQTNRWLNDHPMK